MDTPERGDVHGASPSEELRRLCEDVCRAVMDLTGADGCLAFLPSEDRSRLDAIVGFPLPGEAHRVLVDTLVGVPVEAYELARHTQEGHASVLHRGGEGGEPVLQMLDVLEIATLAQVPAPLVDGWRFSVSVAHLRHHDYGIAELEGVQAVLGRHAADVHAAKRAADEREHR